MRLILCILFDPFSFTVGQAIFLVKLIPEITYVSGGTLNLAHSHPHCKTESAVLTGLRTALLDFLYNLFINQGNRLTGLQAVTDLLQL